MFQPLPNKKYNIIYTDPPYDYHGQHQFDRKRDTGGANEHYNTLTIQQLSELDVASVTEDDCLLFMWATSPHLDQAIWLGKEWGFKWATVAFVWDKMMVNPGSYTMSQCELCLVFKKGKIPQPRGARNIRQLVNIKRGKHSEKPSEVRKRIDAMFPTQKKIELFAREEIGGLWDSLGK